VDYENLTREAAEKAGCEEGDTAPVLKIEGTGFDLDAVRYDEV